ncbi:MAG: hypothetical protein RMJ51_06615 [Candidatus Calescibacterium sp.]|nr:hypothetical protein [Candidatus Calescibacterium sp.]MDW8195889.1 hypothetical protein [Candidatus Calescibacterium sp.]
MDPIQRGKIYKIKQIIRDKPYYMNYGLIENTIIKVIDISSDNKNFYLEVVGFNRKLAIAIDILQDIILEEVKDDKEN